MLHGRNGKFQFRIHLTFEKSRIVHGLKIKNMWGALVRNHIQTTFRLIRAKSGSIQFGLEPLNAQTVTKGKIIANTSARTESKAWQVRTNIARTLRINRRAGITFKIKVERAIYVCHFRPSLICHKYCSNIPPNQVMSSASFIYTWVVVAHVAAQTLRAQHTSERAAHMLSKALLCNRISPHSVLQAQHTSVFIKATKLYASLSLVSNGMQWPRRIAPQRSGSFDSTRSPTALTPRAIKLRRLLSLRARNGSTALSRPPKWYRFLGGAARVNTTMFVKHTAARKHSGANQHGSA